MKVRFIGQGFESASPLAVGKILSSLFKKGINEFICLSAFTSPSAVAFLNELFRTQHGIKAKIIVGIDQGGTSEDAIKELNTIQSSDIKAYIFYQAESPIFHPKIYILKDNSNVNIILGSSNLTAQGLFSNVESSTWVSFRKGDSKGEAFLKEITTYFEPLLNCTDSNLFELNDTTVQKFISMRLLPGKAEYKKRYALHTKKEAIDKSFIRPRQVAPIPDSIRKSLSQRLIKSYVEETEPVKSTRDFANATSYTLLWESKKLTERALNVPTSAKTNPTGSINLTKGSMNIDQKTYFRNTVFNSLTWSAKPGTTLETADCPFTLIVRGHDYGEFSLKLTHDTNTASRSFQQNNATTRLSWGSAKAIIADRDLIGKKLRLYKDLSKYYLVIS